MKEKQKKDAQNEQQVTEPITSTAQQESPEQCTEGVAADSSDTVDEVEKLKALLAEQTQKSEEYFSMLQRKVAEFENFKKRTQKEKNEIYNDSVCEVLTETLPILDNLERALASAGVPGDAETFGEGVKLILKQFWEFFNKFGVTPIEAVGEQFDPALHNAVMHIEDEKIDDNTIVEEFLKGYKVKDKVIRYSTVKVAN